jgi:hypothetical protein
VTSSSRARRASQRRSATTRRGKGGRRGAGRERAETRARAVGQATDIRLCTTQGATRPPASAPVVPPPIISHRPPPRRSRRRSHRHRCRRRCRRCRRRRRRHCTALSCGTALLVSLFCLRSSLNPSPLMTSTGAPTEIAATQWKKTKRRALNMACRFVNGQSAFESCASTASWQTSSPTTPTTATISRILDATMPAAPARCQQMASRCSSRGRSAFRVLPVSDLQPSCQPRKRVYSSTAKYSAAATLVGGR